MSLRDDFYSLEATLVNSSKRELANGLEKDPIYKLRLMCFAKGATGLLGLARHLRKIDENSKDSVSYDEFVASLQQSGFCWNDAEIATLFKQFAVNQKGKINTTEFISKLRPSMTAARLNVINKAFEKVDKNSDGIITVQDLKNVYCVRNHPKYLSGELIESEILDQFLDNFSDGQDEKKRKAKVTKEEFINYYATVSASIDNDAYFDLAMRRAYKL